MDDDAALEELARLYPARAADLPPLYARGCVEARAALIGELDVPSPHRSARA